MCTYSMIADHYRDKWQDQQWYPHVWPIIHPSEISRAEFDALKKELEDLKGLLVRAKKYDADHGEPDCEMDDKVALIKRLAELVGVDLGEALP